MNATTAFCLVKRTTRLRADIRLPFRARFQTLSGEAAPVAVPGQLHSFMDILQHSIAVGKYLVSPLIRHTDNGDFAASVSIRSGRGSGTHDRVMRFTPRFTSHAQALRYATEQGLGWVRERTAPCVVAA
jgi:hypothetical protein